MTSEATTAPGVGAPAGEALREWRRGWPTVFAGIFGFMMLTVGLVVGQTFMGPLQAAFHWSSAAYSLCFAMASAPGFFLPPLAGMAVDRFGPKLVAVTGSVLTGASICLFGALTGSVANWVLLWLFFGVAGQIAAQSLWYASVSSAFKINRGLAMSFMIAGSAGATILGPVMMNSLIEAYGFRFAFVAIGVSWGGVTALASLAGIPSRLGSADGGDAAPLTGLTVKQGFRSAAFYKLGFIILASYVAMIALVAHLIALFTSGGLPRDKAVAAVAAYGVALLVGKLASGVAMDKVRAQFVSAAGLLLLIGCLWLLASPAPNLAWALSSAALAGLAFGGFAPTFPYLATRHLGLANFGKLFGALACLYAIASAIGPIVAGYVHDTTHGYTLFLFGCMPPLALAIVLCLTLGPYPDFSGAAQRDR